MSARRPFGPMDTAADRSRIYEVQISRRTGDRRSPWKVVRGQQIVAEFTTRPPAERYRSHVERCPDCWKEHQHKTHPKT